MPRRLRVAFPVSAALPASAGAFTVNGNGATLTQSASSQFDADFTTRSTAPGVVHAYDMSFIGPLWDYPVPVGTLPGELPAFSIWNTVSQSDQDRCQCTPQGPIQDFGVKRSGANSIRFDSPSFSGSNGAGMQMFSFTPDFSVLFGPGETFYVQWRQRFSQAFLDAYNTQVDPSTGMSLGANQTFYPAYPTSYKQLILSPGNNGSLPHYSSNEEQSLIVTSNFMQHFPIIYQETSPDGASAQPLATVLSNGPYLTTDTNLENGRPSPYCTFGAYATRPQSSNDFYTYCPPGCFNYVADQWLTFQISVTVGPYGLGGSNGTTNVYKNTRVRLWAAYESQPSVLLIDWTGDVNSSDPSFQAKYGALWFGPYMSYKDFRTDHPMLNTWYDEVIISRQPIRDPIAGTLPPGTAATTSPLSNLARGKLRDLGFFTAGQGEAPNEDGSIIIDPARQRMLMYGGGHTGTDYWFNGPLVFDCSTATAPMPYVYPPDFQTLPANASTDFVPNTMIYSGTGHVAATHTFPGTCVSGNRYYLMTNGGFVYQDTLTQPPHAMCYWDLTTNQWTSLGLTMPWYYVNSVCVDPVSGRIIVFGTTSALSGCGYWIYDPVANTISGVTPVTTFDDLTYPPKVVYWPPGDKFIVVHPAWVRSDGTQYQAKIYEFVLNRSTFTATYTLIPTTGTLPVPWRDPNSAWRAASGYAYDPATGLVVGHIVSGTYSTYNPASKVWMANTVTLENGSPSTQMIHANYLDCDPVSGCMIFIDLYSRDVCAFRA